MTSVLNPFQMDFESIITETCCRICLISCSSEDEDSSKFKDCYNLCTGLSILDSDIPQKICSDCISDLNKSIAFRNKCVTTEERIQDFLNSIVEMKKEVKLEIEEVQVCVVEPLPEKTIVKKKPVGQTCCDQCGVVCSERHFKAHYDLHFEEIAGPKMFCDICLHTKTGNKTGFTQKSKLREHMRRHLAKRPPKPCPQCGKMLPSTLALRRHIFRIHVDPKEYRLECMVCGKRFFEQKYFVAHKRSHTGEKSHSCHICGVMFSKLNLLTTPITNV